MTTDRPIVEVACIIDDDKLYVNLIKMLIKKYNLAGELVVFENGRDALDHFEKLVDNNETAIPNIVLLDLNMPVMDGWEFLNAIETYEGFFEEHNILLNVVSSTINPIEVDRARSHKIVTEFITKPISKDDMIATFSRA